MEEIIMEIKEIGIDCKNKTYKKVDLKAAKDLSKMKFNRLQPLFRVEAKRVSWLCQCDCGNLRVVQANHLIDNTTQSCGCLSQEKARARSTTNQEGKQYGELTVLKRIYRPGVKGMFWECKCSCGKHTIVENYNLVSGNTKSCGHLRTQIENLTGKKFGYWTVLKMAPREEQHIYWTCICDCGTIKNLRGDELKSGRSQSCGCKNSSRGADKIEQMLKDNNIDYKKEYCFPDLKSPKNVALRYDFAVFKNNNLYCLIEYDGELHYQSRKDFGGEEGLKYRKQCDEIKNQYCRDNNILLYRIPFYDLDTFTYETLMSNNYLIL